MMFPLILEYHQMFWSTVLGSIFMGWNYVVGGMVWFYGDGHLGFNLQAIAYESEEDE
jgi:hypothetical protein